ncbi:hypothetical protein BX070DRAFT_232733 [Coemansia spiralis]|nr:hypothetical protein BX070DRAFT_232733 [Coemansia spiralis]
MDFQDTVLSLREELAKCVKASTTSEISWSWITTIASRILTDHCSGLSRTVLLTELELQWHHLNSNDVMHIETHRTVGPFFHRDGKPPQKAVFGLKIDSMYTIPGTGIWLWRVSGAPSPLDVGGLFDGNERPKQRQNTADMQIDAFVHQRYYPMIEAVEFSGFFSRMRTLYATSLSLADRGGNANGKPNQTLLPTTLLAFELRVGDDYSLAEVLRPYTDEPLLESLFGVRYSNGRFVHCATPAFNADQLWCKVDFIGSPCTRYKDNRLVPHLLMECLIEHEDPPRVVNISFWDEEIAVGQLFKQDYYIGLLCPMITSAASDKIVEAEYGPQTIAFVTCAIRGPVNTLASQLSIAYNDLGYLDYKRYAHRVRLARCRPEMINLTLLVRIVAVSDNIPFEEDGQITDRCAVRIEDGTATRDLTMWGELGQQALRLLPGQLVLLTGVEAHDENGDVVLNGSSEIGALFYNISTMSGILASSMMRTYTFLSQLPKTANRYCKACVVAVSSAGKHMRDARDRLLATSLVHAICGRQVIRSDVPSNSPLQSEQLENPTDFYSFDCLSCGASSLKKEEVESGFVLLLGIDDGTDSITTHVTASTACDMLGVSPAQFLNLPSQCEQQSVLAKLLGQEFVLSITLYCEPLSIETVARIDAACLASDIGYMSI